MAEHSGLSKSTVGRSRRKFQLKPHLTDTFRLSTDPLFVEKPYDVVGLCFNPPDGAVALSVDEETQIQALDRSQPVLPIMPGMPERRTHDYVRNGLTTLYFTPTGSSWINQVERWFGFLADQKIRRGAHKNVQALEADIRARAKDWNEDPKPFIWTKTAEEILDSLALLPMVLWRRTLGPVWQMIVSHVCGLGRWPCRGGLGHRC